ncbi:myosin-VIIa-like isoform X2 [Biomphalaria glabrata]|uniref:Myosin-VIIa-like isoform X2 n=1 Tax=Biomphalaria glabrata TaxID=6526 RepID=A0A9W2Z0I3_BIOGL|nr:myosin-VIIa-like isoform X2 [Biomphalaria glabrata]
MQAIKGDHIWLEVDKKSEFSVPIGATVIGTDSGQIQLLDDDGREHWVDGGQVFRPMHVTSVDGVQDMISLGDFSEAGILRNLFIRYKDNQIYTYTGSILISVNPYQDLPIYSQEQVERYKAKKIGELPPHIFAIADNAYGSMHKSNQDQCIIISGESGSGKSECTKFILQYLASVSGQQSSIEQQILQAYPILEAFGNAKTIQNDNSSRFGKYIDIHFDERGVIECAKIEQYLLEKSRIVSQRKGERNYHIFYGMLAGLTAEGKAMFEVQDSENFEYLLQGERIECEGREDEKDFDEFRSAMKVLMFDDEDMVNILKILSALLHIGNVRFNEFELDNIEASEIEDVTGINITASFLEVDPQALIDALTTKTIFAKDESVTYTMKKMQAMDVRDAFAKGIYGRLFIWIVNKINAVLYKPQYHKKKSIKVLDIFSFENFDKNSFEQLCINYAIESLQQFFVTHVFKLEQAEYNNEGINWKNIEFVDNQGVLDLIADKPMNILALMDEESKFPKGTDESMLNKLHFYHSNNQYYLKPKAAVTQTFGLKHFAGLVVYDPDGFLEKNRDTFSSDLVQLIQTSKSKFLKTLFASDITETDARKKAATLATQFKKSLEQLMATLNVCHPYFVRCIKPNDVKRPQVFDRALCCKQLRYLGMMETIRIRRAGYPIRHRYNEFVTRYRMLVKGLAPASMGDSKTMAGKICSALLNNADFRLGKTKLFLKVAQDSYLEQLRENILSEKMSIIQLASKTWLCRKRYLKMKQGFTRLQAVYRSKILSTRYRKIFQWIINLQSFCRGYLLRKTLKRKEFCSLQTQELYQQRSVDLTDSSGGQTHDSPNVVEHKTSAQEISKEDLKTSNSFAGFAAKYFQDNATSSFTTKALRKSLLQLDDVVDQIASLAVWTVILQFMLNRQESEDEEDKKNYRCVMSRLHTTLEKKLNYQDLEKIVSDTTNEEQAGSSTSVAEDLSVLMTLSKLNCFLADPPLSDLERVHFVVGLGILRPHLRDEIYCQLCKQLTNNDNNDAVSRGWTLLSLCAISFPPSQKLFPYLSNFVSDSQMVQASSCESFLQKMSGLLPRKQPPCWMEYQFVGNKTAISLSVTLTDGNDLTFNVTPFIIVEDLKRQISDQINLKDEFGFSLFMTTSDKMVRVEDGSYVMDAVSLSEQEAKEAGCEEEDGNGKMIFRKEIFTPWHDSAADPVATDLIYSQVVEGVSTDEYSTDQEDDLAMFAAQRYFIENGLKLDKDSLKSLINTYIPDTYIQGESDVSRWVDLISVKLKDSYFSNNITDALKVKQDVVSYARYKWPLLFSRFYEVSKLNGPQLSKDEALIAVNWTGVYAVDHDEQILLELSFPEIFNITASSFKTSGMSQKGVALLSVGGDMYTCLTSSADNLGNLIKTFIDGLKERSKYAIAIKSCSFSENTSQLIFKKGDFIQLDNQSIKSPGTQPLSYSGLNMNNNQKGKFSTDCVYIIPTITKPPLVILNLLTHWANSQRDVEVGQSNATSTKLEKEADSRKVKFLPTGVHHTLQHYARDYFRSSKKSKQRNQELWKYSKDPLKKPLLKDLIGQEDLSSMAHESYIGILKYMGDYPSKKTRISSVFFTDQIFSPALSNDFVREEIYCIIMKQLTDNKNSVSEARGWELMWLAVGLCEPGTLLLQELNLFLSSRSHIKLAAESLQRLEKRKNKSTRKVPPHLEEVEAVQQKMLKISHEVHFPNGNDETFEIDSSTTAADLCQEIAKHLRLKSVEGFSLYIQIGDKSYSIPGESYYFDFLRSLTTENNAKSKSQKKGEQGASTVSYELLFQKKIWVETIPGDDLQADLIFHYNQMFPTYFKGHHKCNKEEAAQLGALVYRVMNGEDESNLSQFPEILSELMPIDLMCEQPTQEWTDQIISAFHKYKGKNKEGATVEFLKIMSTWGTFGSEFFEVTQVSESNLPGKLILAINENGVHLLDLKTKAQHMRYPLSKISSCKSDDSSFFIVLKSSLDTDVEFKCLTKMGYRMQDLLSSYMKLIN